MTHWKIGSATITRVEEQLGPGSFPPEQYFSGFEREVLQRNLDWLVPHHYIAASDVLITSVHSWLIRTPQHTILVDACSGNHKDRHWWPRFHQLDTPFIDRLATAGARPEDIDMVLCTHLHADHIGWNTRLQDGRWVPTFPNARYIFHRKEYEVWERDSKNEGTLTSRVFKDNCLPIVEAGQALLVEDEYCLDDMVSLLPTPGHSPHHCCVVVQSKGKKAIITGDLFHHAIQCCVPKWSSCFDWDAKQSAVSREKFLASVADTDAVILPIHFPNPTAGFICSAADSFHYQFKR